MSQYLQDGYHYGDVAANAPVSERIAFIRKTYLTLSVSVFALVGTLAALSYLGLGREIVVFLFKTPYMLLGLIALFIGGGFLARWMARAEAPPVVKYAGLALYTAIQALFLLPLVTYAEMRFGLSIINEAAAITLVTFGGLSAVVLITKKDFSFLGFGLMVLSWLAFGIVLVAVVGALTGWFHLGLGIWFSAAMIALAAGYILYDTSNIMHYYSTDEHVGAAIELLADVVLLFYYVLRLLMQLRSQD
jgi:hypothetical protein